MEQLNANLTPIDWANIKAYVAKQQQETAGQLGTAIGLIGSLGLSINSAPNWGWWFVAMWGGIWWMLRKFDKKAAAATKARDELDIQQF